MGTDPVLVLLEHDRGTLHDASLEALTAARSLAIRLGADLHAVTLVADADAAGPHAWAAADHGATATHVAVDPLLADYGPEAWGAALAAVADAVAPVAVVATGTDRGNEVLAQFAARADLAFSANCLSVDPHDDGPWRLVRSRWGGSLLEEAVLAGAVRVLSFGHHSVEPATVPSPGPVATTVHRPGLDSGLGRTVVVDRVLPETGAGATLATAKVVVGGGRGVGSAEGFSVLEELAALLDGRVGCSRAVTNNGWRNHTDQVGQTGTRIAPDIYLACGISGAIQHWVGAMASKKILAINTDPEANMVARADYAVIGDLHQVVPAIAAEIRRRRDAS